MEKGGSFSLKHHANTIDKIDTKRFVDENWLVSNTFHISIRNEELHCHMPTKNPLANTMLSPLFNKLPLHIC